MAQIELEQIQSQNFPYRSIVFDMDGTLYDQKKLRQIMRKEIFFYSLSHPHKIQDFFLLWSYRKKREELANAHTHLISRLQFEEIAIEKKVSFQKIETLVLEWILQRPLRHLKRVLFPGVIETLSLLQTRGVKFGLLSDYPGEEKLAAMDLKMSWCVDCSSKEVDILKPNPKGLQKLLTMMQTHPQETLVIGDRNERDGLCAKALGCDFLLVERNDFYLILLERLSYMI